MLRFLGIPKTIGAVTLGTSLVACGRPPLPADSASETGFTDDGSDGPVVTTTISTSSSGPTSSTGTPETSDTGTPGSCDAIDLGSEVDVSVFGDTQDFDHQWSVPCIDGGSAPEALYRWRAPYSGNFIFDTFGSPFDTALVLRGPDCEPVLDCNDDTEGSAASAIFRYLEANEEVVIQVDGFVDASGPYQLNVRDAGGGPPGQCPVDEIWEVPTEWYGNTASGSNQFSSECGGQGGPEVGVLFVPPWDGLYYIESWGEAPTLISVHEEVCGGPLLFCTPEPWGEVYLNAGVPVIIMVDSHEPFTGEVGFWIDSFDAPPPPPPGGECPEGFLPSQTYVEVFGNTQGAPNSLGGGCGGQFASDHTYEFIAPVSGEYRVRTAGSEYDTLLHVRRDGCNGPEVACNDDTWQLLSQVFFVAEAGERFIITVDGFDTDSGPYRLEVALQ